MFASLVNVFGYFLIWVGIAAILVLVTIVLVGIYIEKRKNDKDKSAKSTGNIIYRIFIYVIAGAAALFISPLLLSWLNII